MAGERSASGGKFESGFEPRSETGIVAALVAIAWLVGMTPILIGGHTFDSEPHLASSLPWFDRLGESLAAGALPEWDDDSGLGAAVALEVGRPLVYPAAWLVAALPRPWGIDAVLLLHLLLFGLGAAAWARRLGADPMGAVIAGSVAALSGAMGSILLQGGAVLAAAWLPWIGWGGDRLAGTGGGIRRTVGGALVLAALLACLLLAAGGLAGASLAAPVVAAAAILVRAPGRGSAWIGLAASLAAALLLSAVAWLPAAALGALRVGELAPGPLFHPAEIPALVLALWGALARPRRLRRLALASASLIAIAVLVPISPDGFPAAAAALVAPLAGLGATRVRLALDGLDRLARWRATAGALLATIAIGPLAARAWRLPFEERDLVERPPALLAAVAGQRHEGGERRRIGWPANPHLAYRDAPPETGARFGFAYVPGRDLARDPLLADLWRAWNGAGERLLDLYGVEYAVRPASVAVPAAMVVAGQSADGERVLVENTRRRPRALVASSWSWHPDAGRLRGELVSPSADRQAAFPLAHVRLLGAGRPRVSAPSGADLDPAPCTIASARPEEVELTCRSPSGGYAVLLDRAAPGWTAEVDGRPAAVVTADLLARAVAVGPGRHQVRFRYRTPGLRLGGALSAAAWLNAAALALLLRRMRGHDRVSVVPIEPG